MYTFISQYNTTDNSTNDYLNEHSDRHPALAAPLKYSAPRLVLNYSSIISLPLQFTETLDLYIDIVCCYIPTHTVHTYILCMCIYISISVYPSIHQFFTPTCMYMIVQCLYLPSAFSFVVFAFSCMFIYIVL